MREAEDFDEEAAKARFNQPKARPNQSEAGENPLRAGEM